MKQAKTNSDRKESFFPDESRDADGFMQLIRREEADSVSMHGTELAQSHSEKPKKKKGKKGKKGKKNKKESKIKAAFHKAKTVIAKRPKAAMSWCSAGTSGVFFGGHSTYNSYIGLPEGEDGHIMIVGGSGSGKTSGILMPTLDTWHGSMVVIDPKGDLCDKYAELSEDDPRYRPFIRFDPNDPKGPSYDPFSWLSEDGEENLPTNLADLAQILVPDDNHIGNDPFWRQSERGIIHAALLYFYRQGLSFPESVAKIQAASLVNLAKALGSCDDLEVKALINNCEELKDSKTLPCIGFGVSNHLRDFTLDSVAHALRGKREGANCFDWDDLTDYNIFICGSLDKMDVWGRLYALMIQQLLRHLERHQEKYGNSSSGSPQTLVIIDELARLGKIPHLPDAASTLRSKSVNLLFTVQSLVQLDNVYGTDTRRVLVDNCPYQLLLGANDVDTQEYFAKRIGTTERAKYQASRSLSTYMEIEGYGESITPVREYIIQPHELSKLDNPILLSPSGAGAVDKYLPWEDRGVPLPQLIYIGNRRRICKRTEKIFSNEGATMKPLSKRIETSNLKLQTVRQEKHKQAAAVKKEKSLRHHILGSILENIFPELNDIEMGSAEENDARFSPVRQVSLYLASHPEIINAALAGPPLYEGSDDVYEGQGGDFDNV